MRTKNELYQLALRTVAMRRQTARALAQDAQAEAEAAAVPLPEPPAKTAPKLPLRLRRQSRS